MENCNGCLFSQGRVAGSGKQSASHVTCRRYPQSYDKSLGDWCGEYKVGEASVKDDPAKVV